MLQLERVLLGGALERELEAEFRVLRANGYRPCDELARLGVCRLVAHLSPLGERVDGQHPHRGQGDEGARRDPGEALMPPLRRRPLVGELALGLVLVVPGEHGGSEHVVEDLVPRRPARSPRYPAQNPRSVQRPSTGSNRAGSCPA